MKIKEFFEKKSVKIVEGIVVAVASGGLIYGGASAESIAKIPTLAVGVFTAIEAVITLIQGFTTKSA
jgi:hypothetical protein